MSFVQSNSLSQFVPILANLLDLLFELAELQLSLILRHAVNPQLLNRLSYSSLDLINFLTQLDLHGLVLSAGLVHPSDSVINVLNKSFI
jgi:hypothetical protein